MRIPAARTLLVSLLAAVAASAGCKKKDRDPNEVLVAGASDLVYAMEEVLPRFEEASGKKTKFTPGSSGKLAAQIREGAPYDVFFSANVAFVDDVIAAGACDADTKALYARGRIVLWAGPDGPAPPDDLTALTDSRYRRIAIANPDHAPYGAAAKQALQAAGIWDRVESRMVYGTNIKSTMQFAETGNAEMTIIALSLAKKAPGPHTVIPEELHRPIDQALVVCTGGGATEGGRELAALMATDEIRQIMESYGFVVPDGGD